MEFAIRFIGPNKVSVAFGALRTPQRSHLNGFLFRRQRRRRRRIYLSCFVIRCRNVTC